MCPSEIPSKHGAEPLNFTEAILNRVVHNGAVNVDVVVYEHIPKANHVGPLVAQFLPDQSFGLENVGKS